MTAYRITNWDRLYETAETRKIKRLAWVPTRNKHDGLGFRRMTREKDPCELFTAWNLMLQIASKGEGKDRGTLTREGQPLEPEDLQMMTGFPSRIFKRGIEFFSSHNIAWLEKIREISGQPPDDIRTTSGCHPAEQKEQNRTEQKEEKEIQGGTPKTESPPSIALNRDSWTWTGITDADRTAWASAYPAVNLDSEIAAAAQWCRTAGAKGYKSRYDRFIVGWLKRAQDKGGGNGAAAHQFGRDTRKVTLS